MTNWYEYQQGMFFWLDCDTCDEGFHACFGIEYQTVAYVMRFLKVLNCEWQFGTNTNKVCLSGLIVIHVMRIFMLVFGIDNQTVEYVMRLLKVS